MADRLEIGSMSAGGTWSYRLDLGIDTDGRREQKQVVGFRTKKAVWTALNEALAGLQRGTYVAPSRQTVAGFLELWIDGVRSELAITARLALGPAWTNTGYVFVDESDEPYHPQRLLKMFEQALRRESASKIASLFGPTG